MRDVTAQVQEALRAERIMPFILYEGEFGDATIRLWTGIGTLTWDLQEWSGLGTLLSFSPIEESSEPRNTGFSVVLSGVPQENISLAIQEVQQGKRGTIWLGLMDEEFQVIPDPMKIGVGRLDVPEINEDGETATIRVSYESDLVDLERPRGGRWTHEAQQSLFPGDKGFEHVAGLQNADIAWGRRR